MPNYDATELFTCKSYIQSARPMDYNKYKNSLTWFQILYHN